jgi:hypothetical protein
MPAAESGRHIRTISDAGHPPATGCWPRLFAHFSQTHLASINWLISHHRVRASVTLTQVEFGWEIASTHWRAAHFQVKNYWLRSRAR